MCKKGVFFFIYVITLMVFGVTGVHARDSRVRSKQVDQDNILQESVIEKTLDQIERNLDRPVVKKEIFPDSKLDSENFVEKLEPASKNIWIEVKTLQIVLNDDHPEGVDWEAIVSDYRKLMFFYSSVEMDTENAKSLSLGSVLREDYGILLEALGMVGVIRTLSERKVAVKTDVQPHVAQIYQDEETQLFLNPMIKEDGLLKVSVKPEFIDGSVNSFKGVSQPSAAVEMKDGATIVIGGLFEEVMIKSLGKVPLLGNLPLLGFVFRNHGEELRKAEVITFVTVNIDE